MCQNIANVLSAITCVSYVNCHFTEKPVSASVYWSSPHCSVVVLSVDSLRYIYVALLIFVTVWISANSPGEKQED